MGFSQKMKTFFKEKGLNNRQVSEVMEGYSESLISRYINSDKVSLHFLNKLLQYFPDVDVNYMIKDEDALEEVAEKPAATAKENILLIEEIQQKLEQLKNNLSL
jgi:hypothetical protein